MEIVKLIPDKKSKYHFGEGSLEESSIIFHSNSLFSTIINNFIKLYGTDEFENNRKYFNEIKISSLFPAIYQFENKNSEKRNIKNEILFLPKPMLKLNFKEHVQKEIEDKPKEIKKVKFISLDALSIHNNNNEKLDKIIIGKEYLITEKEKKDFGYINTKNISLFNELIEQKISIDRIKGTTLESDGKGQLYITKYIVPLGKKDKENNIENKVGFYFLIDLNNMSNDFKKKIKASIKLIKDEGIGGKRSTGAGIFSEIIVDKFDNKLNENNTNAFVSLSITIPKNEDELNSFESYQLIKVGGYIYSSTKIEYIKKLKKIIYVLSEGSICNTKINGTLKDLKPVDVSHEIILNGKPLLLPISYEK